MGWVCRWVSKGEEGLVVRYEWDGFDGFTIDCLGR